MVFWNCWRFRILILMSYASQKNLPRHFVTSLFLAIKPPRLPYNTWSQCLKFGTASKRTPNSFGKWANDTSCYLVICVLVRIRIWLSLEALWNCAWREEQWLKRSRRVIPERRKIKAKTQLIPTYSVAVRFSLFPFARIAPITSLFFVGIYIYIYLQWGYVCATSTARETDDAHIIKFPAASKLY